MNVSQLADAETCMACGKCCESFLLWFPKGPDIVERLQLLSTGDSVEVRQDYFPDQALVEIKKPCIHYRPGQGCGIYAAPERPSLCSEYPDNLFNRNEEGGLVLDDEHAARMIALYSAHCPVVQRLGRTLPPTLEPPSPTGPEPPIPVAPEPPRIVTSIG